MVSFCRDYILIFNSLGRRKLLKGTRWNLRSPKRFSSNENRLSSTITRVDSTDGLSRTVLSSTRTLTLQRTVTGLQSSESCGDQKPYLKYLVPLRVSKYTTNTDETVMLPSQLTNSVFGTPGVSTFVNDRPGVIFLKRLWTIPPVPRRYRYDPVKPTVQK